MPCLVSAGWAGPQTGPRPGFDLGRTFVQEVCEHSIGIVSSHAKNNNWLMVKKPGYAAKSAIGGGKSDLDIGTRPCAIFEYVGPAFHDKALARAMLE